MKPQAACIGYTMALLSLAAGNAACKSRPAPARPAAAAKLTVTPVDPATTVLIHAKDAIAGRIERKGEAWLLSSDGKETVTCQPHDARKSRCQTASGAAIAELKYYANPDLPGDGAIKLVSPDGKLRWKLRFSREKLKLSDNEENRDPWTLSLKHEGKVKVEDPKDQELGVFRRSDGGKGKIQDAKGEALFTVEGAGSSAFPALLLIPDITPLDRLLLASEMLAHGL